MVTSDHNLKHKLENYGVLTMYIISECIANKMVGFMFVIKVYTSTLD